MTTSNRPQILGSGILVTGGAGFIGSHLVDRLLKEGAREVVVIDNLFTGDESNLESALKTGRAVLYRDDAELSTSMEYIFATHQIDLVFNCATKALNYSFLNPANAFSTNVNVVLNLLELQRRGLFKTLCHFSTSEVYGTAVYEPMDEAHPKNPTTTYAAGKAAATTLWRATSRCLILMPSLSGHSTTMAHDKITRACSQGLFPSRPGASSTTSRLNCTATDCKAAILSMSMTRLMPSSSSMINW